MRYRVVVDVYEDREVGEVLMRRATWETATFTDAMELSDLAWEAVAEAQDVDDDLATP
jgi:hypothetical protein